MICAVGGFVAIDPDQPSEEEDKRIDWFGAFLVTAGLVQIVFALSQGQVAPKKWATPCISSHHFPFYVSNTRLVLPQTSSRCSLPEFS
jgi:hypothetical protein